MYNEIQAVGPNQVLRKRLGIVGESSPAPALAPEVIPVWPIEADRPEWAYLGGERLAAAAPGGAAAPGVGQFAFVALRNPANSGNIIVVEHVRLVAAAGSSIRFLVSTLAPTGTPVIAGVRDSRWIQPGVTSAQPLGQVTSGSNGSVFAEPILWFSEASTTQEFDEPIVLAPGSTLFVQCNTDNIAIGRCNLAWRERPATPDELR